MSDYEQNTGSVRFRYRDIGGAYAQYISAAPAIPLGHAELAVDSGGAPLSNIPSFARRAVFYANNDFTFTDDGSMPSATHGMIIPAGTVFVYDTDPDENFKLWAAALTDVRIAYYG